MAGEVWKGIKEFEAAITAIVSAAEKATGDAVAEAAHLVEAKAKSNASGRPGPNVVTGTLRRSIYVEGPKSVGMGYSAKVGPSVIYARRIELGYQGTDSLGRHYDQPAYPFLKPGLDAARDEISSIFEKHWAASMEAR